MKKYAVFYRAGNEYFTRTVSCFQYGEAYNWTVEDASEEHHCKPGEIVIESIIEVAT